MIIDIYKSFSKIEQIEWKSVNYAFMLCHSCANFTRFLDKEGKIRGTFDSLMCRE